MDNLAIARVLAEIGDLLEIKNENPFKIRAYRNAAETIAHTAGRLADLPAAERLAIPGIGKDLAAKITELIETGTLRYHQDLLQEFPPRWAQPLAGLLAGCFDGDRAEDGAPRACGIGVVPGTFV